MKKILLFLFITSFAIAQNNEVNKITINTILDNWHKAAAEAKFETYMNVLTDDAIYWHRR